jgi:hypothetical protein
VRNVGAILVLQAGMIGLWGEWHHSVHGLDADADPRLWQPYRPGDADFRPLVHEVRLSIPGGIPALRPGRYQIGLWLPDSDPVLRLDSRYAIRCANRDSAWKAEPGGKWGINILGTIEVVP